MITAAQWVPRGFAAPYPKKYELDETEYGRIAELAKLQLDDAEEDLKEAQEDEASPGGVKTLNDDDEMEDDTKQAKTTVKCVGASHAHTMAKPLMY